jgi:hypothetical protein
MLLSLREDSMGRHGYPTEFRTRALDLTRTFHEAGVNSAR